MILQNYINKIIEVIKVKHIYLKRILILNKIFIKKKINI